MPRQPLILYRVCCRFEPDFYNAMTGRMGQWRVFDVVPESGYSFYPAVLRAAPPVREVSVLSTKPYPRGSIIRPHKELKKVLQLRKVAA